MGDWSYLSSLLDKVQSHSTIVGKIWMSVLFLFRIFILGAAADKIWSDERSRFLCDSHEPGCAHLCYNWRFPISYVHYWLLQVIFVSTPTLVYLGHAVHIIHREKRMMEQQQNEAIKMKPKYTNDRGKVEIKGVLFCTYMTQLIFKIFIEIGFSVGQFYIFGSLFVERFFHCSLGVPCSYLTGSQCYISRPTEKTIFVFFNIVISGISVLLNIIEIIYLLCNKRRKALKKLQQRRLSSHHHQQHPANPQWRGMSHYRGFPLTPLTTQSMTEQEEKHSDFISKEKEI